MLCAALVALSAAASWVQAASLSPDELLLVYNQDDPRSRELVEYYAQARSVPRDRMCPVRVAWQKEELSRADFDRYLRGPIREYLEQHDFGRRIRCIVLFYGLPIRVGAKVAVPAEQQLAQRYQDVLKGGIAQLEQLTARVESVDSRPAPQSTPASDGPDENALNRAIERYGRAQLAAWQRLAPELGTEAGQAKSRTLMGIMQAAEGVTAIYARAELQPQQPDVAAQLKVAIEQARKDDERIRELRNRDLTDPARDEARKWIQQNYGLIGQLRAISSDIQLARVDETVASVDSELTLIWSDHPLLYRWVLNPLNWQVRAKAGPAGQLPPEQQERPPLMTCRIDGPSLSAARRIIDDSIAVEKKGLTGRVYIDARGLPEDKAYGLYDADLRELAAMLQRYTKLDVRLDNRPDVFAPGTCPDAMLYCGWYSVRKYVNAFTFVPGAIACHLASFEAITIKTPGEQGWVRGLLSDGADATFGPVAEPYLQAFPRPTKFFGLLLTGRFTLAECYAYTAEMNSWMLLMIGDPLYRPFAVNPQLQLEQVYPAAQIPPEFREGAGTQPASEPSP